MQNQVLTDTVIIDTNKIDKNCYQHTNFDYFYKHKRYYNNIFESIIKIKFSLKSYNITHYKNK